MIISQTKQAGERLAFCNSDTAPAMNSACGLVIRRGDVTWRSWITHNPLYKILCRYARATIESNPSTLLKSSSEEKYSVRSSNLVWSELLAGAFKSKVRLFCLFEWCCLQRSWNLILAWLHVKCMAFHVGSTLRSSFTNWIRQAFVYLHKMRHFYSL